MSDALVSRHWFRRTARRKARKLREQGIRATVIPAKRGPYRWEVRELHDNHKGNATNGDE